MAERAFLLVQIGAVYAEPRDGVGLRVIMRVRGRIVFDNFLRGATVVSVELPTDARGGDALHIDYIGATHPRMSGHAETRFITVSFVRIWLLTGPSNLAWQEAAFPDRFASVSDADLGAHLAGGEGALLARFEGLGHNCDFALIQREIGIEPLGLLRFIGLPVAELILGLLTSFAEIAAPENIKPVMEPSTDEWYGTERRYLMRWNTRIRSAAATAEQIVAREVPHLRFLARKFAEDLIAGEKVFLLKREDLMPWEPRAVWLALNAHAPNKMLFLTRGKPAVLHARAVRGPLPATRADWIRICGNAGFALS